MASALGCEVIAEGIETQNQLDQLLALGIPAYQGWLFAPALPTHKLVDYFPRLNVPNCTRHTAIASTLNWRVSG